MIRRVLRRVFCAAAALALLSGSPGAQEDHLKCYKVKDPLRLKGPPPAWLDLTGPQFGSEECKIVGGFRLFCVPVQKTITAPIQRKFAPPGGPFVDTTPDPLPGETLTEDKICYKIECTEKFPEPPNPGQAVFDQFGNRTIEKLKPFLLCGPAGKGARFVFELTGDQETPPVTTSASGSCTAVLNEAQTQLAVECTHTVTNPTGAHIHRAPPGTAGPIVFPFSNPTSPINETWNLTPQDVQDLLAGNLYVNVHSSAHPGGEIRGQILDD